MPDLFDYPGPTYGNDESSVWGNSALRAPDGKLIQVRTRRTSPLWTVSFGWVLSPEQMQSVDDFIRGIKAEGSTCYLFTPSYWRYWEDVPAGTGDGAEVNFPFPGRDVETGTDMVKVGGVAQTRGVDYSLGYDGTDVRERQRIVFEVASTPGAAAVTISYRGRRQLEARLELDSYRVVPTTFQRYSATAVFVGEECST